MKAAAADFDFAAAAAAAVVMAVGFGSFALRTGQEQQRLTDDLQQVHECQRCCTLRCHLLQKRNCAVLL